MKPLHEPLLSESRKLPDPQQHERRPVLAAISSPGIKFQPRQPEDDAISEGDTFSLYGGSDSEEDAPYIPPAQMFRVVSRISSRVQREARVSFSPTNASAPELGREWSEEKSEDGGVTAPYEGFVEDLRELVAEDEDAKLKFRRSSKLEKTLSRRSVNSNSDKASAVRSRNSTRSDGSAKSSRNERPTVRSSWSIAQDVIKEDTIIGYQGKDISEVETDEGDVCEEMSLAFPESSPDSSMRAAPVVHFSVPHTAKPPQPSVEEEVDIIKEATMDDIDIVAERSENERDAELEDVVKSIREDVSHVSEEDTEKAPKSATLWKKHANVSKTGKIYQVLRQEARHVLETGLADIKLDRIGQLAKEIMGLQATTAAQPPVPSAEHPEEVDEVVDHNMWERCNFLLEKREESELPDDYILCWGKGLIVNEDILQHCSSSIDEIDMTKRREFPLRGSSVTHLGVQCNGKLHAFRVFFPPSIRRRHLTLAAETLEEAENWVNSIRSACAFPPPKRVLPRSLYTRVMEFFLAKGPEPEFEPPAAVLDIGISAVSNLTRQKRKIDNGRNVYVLGRVRDEEFRTATQYGCRDRDDVFFDERFQIALECDGADEAIVFNVYDEPEFEDHEPELLGTISLPLYAVGRDKLAQLEMPLRQTNTTRDGIVHMSFGDLSIKATLHQPLGHLWLPVEPPLSECDNVPAPSQENIDFVDLEMQIARLDSIITTWEGFVATLATIIQWEWIWYSCAWLIFFEVWALFLWRWSLAIVIALLLKCALELRCANVVTVPSSTDTRRRTTTRRKPSDLSCPDIEVIPPGDGSGREGDTAVALEISHSVSTSSAEQLPTPQDVALAPPNKRVSGASGGSLNDVFGLTVDGRSRAPTRWHTYDDTDEIQEHAHDGVLTKILWEVERRLVFFGFDKTYLHEFDPPNWATVTGEACAGPTIMEVDADGDTYRWQWKVIVDHDTDENGWQYAWLFNSTEWRTTFDASRTWVRRRKHHGTRGARLETNQLTSSVALLNLEADPQPAAPTLGSHQTAANSSWVGGPAQSNVEQMLTDVNQFRRYFQLYHAIMHEVVEWFFRIEKHLNLFTWKDYDATKVFTIILCVFLGIAVLVPTRVVMAIIIGFTFYIGLLTGQMKRMHRRRFLETLSGWCTDVCGEEFCLGPYDTCESLELQGITRLTLRNWCNNEFRVALDLRTVDQCHLLGDLADVVVRMSPMFEKTVRRYRAWHSDPYLNFLDHVPSNAADHDIVSFCYHPAARTSLPPIPT